MPYENPGNPTHWQWVDRSGCGLQTKAARLLPRIPPTAVRGSLKSSLHSSATGFSFFVSFSLASRGREITKTKGDGRLSSCRLGLNNPPTSVGGIPRVKTVSLCRLDLNNPPSSVGGIPGVLAQSLPWLVFPKSSHSLFRGWHPSFHTVSEACVTCRAIHTHTRHRAACSLDRRVPRIDYASARPLHSPSSPTNSLRRVRHSC